MLERFGLWLVDGIGALGYPGIVLLMALESSVFPVPSELVMPPAGYLAATQKMDLLVALACGTFGSLIGAYVNYVVASRVGRWIFVRYGRWVLLSSRSLERTERFFARHGEIATFIGRLFPVIRHLISIPAGLARMRLDRFILFTGAGAAIWCSVLLGVGWLIGKAGGTLNRDQVALHTRHVVVLMIPISIALVAAYVWWQRRRGARGKP
jgi:membrane protein DedA with SNARE-associated domain